MLSNTIILPPEGHIFLCEVDGRLKSMPAETASLSTFTNVVSKHPVVNVTRELLHHAQSATRENAQQLFLPTREPLSKRVISTWYQLGLRHALELAAEEGGGFAGNILRHIFAIVDKFSGPKLTQSLHVNNVFSPIRMVAWHPHTLALAVAAWDDSIRLFSPEESLSCILKTKMQRTVTSIAWRPYTASTLVVGCAEGIVVWSRDPNNKTSMVCVSFLKSPNNSPITTVAWDPQGSMLLSASLSQGNIHIWNTEMEKCVKLPRKMRGGTGLVLWSPSKLHLLTASIGAAFYVWDCRTWSSERWTVARGRVIAACFSPCGSFLLFTSSEEPLVFAISMRATINAMAGSTPATQQAANLILDHSLTETDAGVRWGGLINLMAWDPNGRYLAMTSFETDLVTVFNTQIGETLTLNIVSCCAINGKPGEKPSHICFQPEFENGTLLTIAWSSGRVQFFPFVYGDTAVKLHPLQDVSGYIQMLSTPQKSPAVPVQQQSAYTSTPLYQSTNQFLSSQSPHSYTPQHGLYSPAQQQYTSNSPSPLVSQSSSFFTPGAHMSTPAQHSFFHTSATYSPINTSLLRSTVPQTPGTPQW